MIFIALAFIVLAALAALFAPAPCAPPSSPKPRPRPVAPPLNLSVEVRAYADSAARLDAQAAALGCAVEAFTRERPPETAA